MSDDAKYTASFIAAIAAIVSAILIGTAAQDKTERLPMAEKGCYVEVTEHNSLFGEDTKTIKEFCETRKSAN